MAGWVAREKAATVRACSSCKLAELTQRGPMRFALIRVTRAPSPDDLVARERAGHARAAEQIKTLLVQLDRPTAHAHGRPLGAPFPAVVGAPTSGGKLTVTNVVKYLSTREGLKRVEKGLAAAAKPRP